MRDRKRRYLLVKKLVVSTSSTKNEHDGLGTNMCPEELVFLLRHLIWGEEIDPMVA